MVRYVAIGAVALIAFIIFLTSWVDVKPGEQGFVFKPYNSPSIDEDDIYQEGTFFILPWNSMITYEIVNKSKQFNQQVMDINGTDVTLDVSVNYNIEPNNVAKIHIKHRENYTTFIDDKAKGAIKDVIGRYTYEQVYSSKREALEGEIETILEGDFEGNFINLNYVEIADVNLPPCIATQIEEKETQKQRNLTAKEKQKEQLEKFKDHSVFVGYGPIDNPKYIASIIIENGGSGSSLAAPLAHEILNFAEKNNV